MSNDEFQVECEEYQGGSTAILQIFKTQMHDAGTYTLRGENRNGSDKVDLDLVVLDTSHDIECEMLKNANLECRCSQSFRSNISYFIKLFHENDKIFSRTSELSPQMQIAVDFAEQNGVNGM